MEKLAQEYTRRFITVDPAVKGGDYTVEMWEKWDTKKKTVHISFDKGKTWHLKYSNYEDLFNL